MGMRQILTGFICPEMRKFSVINQRKSDSIEDDLDMCKGAHT